VSPGKYSVIDYGQERQLQVMPSLFQSCRLYMRQHRQLIRTIIRRSMSTNQGRSRTYMQHLPVPTVSLRQC